MVAYLLLYHLPNSINICSSVKWSLSVNRLSSPSWNFSGCLSLSYTVGQEHPITISTVSRLVPVSSICALIVRLILSDHISALTFGISSPPFKLKQDSIIFVPFVGPNRSLAWIGVELKHKRFPNPRIIFCIVIANHFPVFDTLFNASVVWVSHDFPHSFFSLLIK